MDFLWHKLLENLRCLSTMMGGYSVGITCSVIIISLNFYQIWHEWWGSSAPLNSRAVDTQFQTWHSLDSYFDEFVQERRNSIANTLELRLSCTNPSICPLTQIGLWTKWKKKFADCIVKCISKQSHCWLIWNAIKLMYYYVTCWLIWNLKCHNSLRPSDAYMRQ